MSLHIAEDNIGGEVKLTEMPYSIAIGKERREIREPHKYGYVNCVISNNVVYALSTTEETKDSLSYIEVVSVVDTLQWMALLERSGISSMELEMAVGSTSEGAEDGGMQVNLKEKV